MKKRDREAIASMVILLIIVFATQGITGVFDFIINMATMFWAMLIMLNQVSVGLTGDTVLVLIFSTTITFGIVGIILELLNIPRGTFGHYFGKFAFWLVGFPVSFILNFLWRVFFS